MARRRELEADLRIEFVPLPPEKRAAWEYAMRIINQYMRLAELELAANQPQQAADDVATPVLLGTISE